MSSKTNVVEFTETTETTKKSNEVESTETYRIDSTNLQAFLTAWNKAVSCSNAVKLLQADFPGMGNKQASGHASQLRKKSDKEALKWAERNNVTDEDRIQAARDFLTPKKFRGQAEDLADGVDDMLAGI